MSKYLKYAKYAIRSILLLFLFCIKRHTLKKENRTKVGIVMKSTVSCSGRTQFHCSLLPIKLNLFNNVLCMPLDFSFTEQKGKNQ